MTVFFMVFSMKKNCSKFILFRNVQQYMISSFPFHSSILHGVRLLENRNVDDHEMNADRRTLSWNYFAWRLNYFDATFTWASWPRHHHATSKDRWSYATQVLCLKRKMKHWFWYVNSSAFPSSGNDNARVIRHLIKSKILQLEMNAMMLRFHASCNVTW